MKNNKYKILLVEDDGNIRTVIAATSGNFGLSGDTGRDRSDGRNFVFLLSAGSHILDLGLPDMVEWNLFLL